MGNFKIVVDGVVQDLKDDFNISVESTTGMGMPTTNNLNTELALQPGALIEGQTYSARNMMWSCFIDGTSQTDYHDNRQDFVKALNPNTGKINERITGVEVRYTGATVHKKINVVYDGGLELQNGNRGFAENFDLRLRADDPLWKALSDTTTALDSNDSATFRLVAKRNGDASVPIWDELGPPDAAGTYTTVYSIVEDDTYIYIGGDFSNFNNIAAADNIVRMNKTTGVYSAMDSGLSFRVWDMTLDSNGDLIVVGQFQNASGDADADYIARWNGTTFEAIGTPNSGAGVSITAVKSVGVASNGDLWFGGIFVNLAGIAAADFVVYYDISASAYVAPGSSGADAELTKLVTAPNGVVYIGGLFTTVDGVTVNRIAKWTGSAWEAMAGGANGNVLSLGVAVDGTLYAGGDFTTIGGNSINRIARWNGQSWAALGSGADDSIDSLTVSDDNLVYVGGDFTEIGGITTADSFAIWNGSTWVQGDIDLPGSATVYAILLDGDDIYLGFDTAGTATYSGDTTIAYGGTANSYPSITVNRSGGTSAKLIQLKNETTGAVLYFDYELLDGETLTIDFNQLNPLMSSSIKGNVFNDLLENSNFGEFYLVPGNATGNNDNVITLFVDTAGSPTITSNIIYDTTYISVD